MESVVAYNVQYHNVYHIEKVSESFARANRRSRIPVSKSSSLGQIQKGHFANRVIENNYDIKLQVQ